MKCQAFSGFKQSLKRGSVLKFRNMDPENSKARRFGKQGNAVLTVQ